MSSGLGPESQLIVQDISTKIGCPLLTQNNGRKKRYQSKITFCNKIVFNECKYYDEIPEVSLPTPEKRKIRNYPYLSRVAVSDQNNPESIKGQLAHDHNAKFTDIKGWRCNFCMVVRWLPRDIKHSSECMVTMFSMSVA